MKYKLYDYQQRAIDFTLKNKTVLLWMDRGTGKTLTSIEIMQYVRKFPVLIVTIASTKFQFSCEIMKFWLSQKIKIQVLSSKETFDPTADIYIINPDILHKFEKELRKKSFEIGIFDEFHYFKEKKSKRSKLLMKISKGMEYKIGMTGTAIMRAPIDLFSQFQILRPHLFGDKTLKYPNRIMNWMEFAIRYSGGRDGHFGFECKSATNVKELEDRTNDMVFRVTKEEALAEIPPVQITDWMIEIPKKYKTEYKRLEKAKLKEFKEIYTDKGFTKHEVFKKGLAMGAIKFMELRKIVSEIKVNYTIEVCKDMQDIDKIILFTAFTKTALTLKEHFGHKAVTIIGSDNAKRRQDHVVAFKNDPNVRYLICNMTAGGVGLNLQNAHHMIFIDLPFNYSEFDQCVGRQHRIGQEKHVQVYKLMVSDTIDKTINDNLLIKKEFEKHYTNIEPC